MDTPTRPERVQFNIEIDREDRDTLARLAPVEERTPTGVVRLLIKGWIAERQDVAA